MTYKLNILFLFFAQVLFGQVYQWSINDSDLSIIESLKNSSGVKIQDNPSKFDYPMRILRNKK